MKRWQAVLAALLAVLSPAAVWAERSGVGDVEVEVIGHGGRSLPEYPLRREDRPGIYKAYVEAKRGQNYSIQIRNRSNQRVGVVVAVDGRNIISGARSELRSDERMYVLGPYQQETYEGWRTGKNRVNRFYFTDAGDSYSGAWGDYSAMGVIAVAAFRENAPYEPWGQGGSGYNNQRGLRPPAEAAPSTAESYRKSEPGTGYGESEWSPSRRVEFDPERRPFVQFFLKYAWRETLCRQGVIDCDGGVRPPRNRLWDEENDRFAPPPPRPERYDGEDWR